MDTDIDVTFEIHDNPACWLSTLTVLLQHLQLLHRRSQDFVWGVHLSSS